MSQETTKKKEKIEIERNPEDPAHQKVVGLLHLAVAKKIRKRKEDLKVKAAEIVEIAETVEEGKEIKTEKTRSLKDQEKETEDLLHILHPHQLLLTETQVAQLKYNLH